VTFRALNFLETKTKTTMKTRRFSKTARTIKLIFYSFGFISLGALTFIAVIYILSDVSEFTVTVLCGIINILIGLVGLALFFFLIGLIIPSTKKLFENE
jgi:hypothetical protein